MLNEASLQNLDNNSYRKESFKKYASLEKPNWKESDINITNLKNLNLSIALL